MLTKAYKLQSASPDVTLGPSTASATEKALDVGDIADDPWPASLLSNLSLRWKPFLIVAAAILGMAAIGVLHLYDLRNELMADRKATTRQLVDVAYSLLSEYEVRANDGLMTRDEAQKQALSAIGALRYGEGEYFWINDLHPRMVLHPYRSDLNGTDISTLTDPTGKRLFVEFAKTVQARGAGFVSYLWPKPGSTEPVRKLSYVKGFKPWGWIIGSGIYIDDIDAIFKRRATVLGISALAILVFVTAITLLIARNISRPIAEVTEGMLRLARGDTSAGVRFRRRKDEIGDLARAMDVFRQNLQEVGRLRREAEETRAQERAALLDSEERYRGMFAQSGLTMLLLDPRDGSIVDANSVACAFYGYSPERMRTLRMDDICVGRDSDLNQIRQHIESGDPLRVACHHTAAGGLRRDVEMHCNPIRIGKRTLVHAIIADETERRQAEGALRASQARIASIFRAAPAGIALISDQKLLEVNERFCAMLGYTPSSLQGQPARILFASQAECDRVEKALSAAVDADAPATLETQWMTEGGQSIEVLLNASPIDPTDLKAGLTVTALDITDRKMAEIAVREREHTMRSLLECAAEGIFGIDLDGVITFCNPACLEILGYDNDGEIIGQCAHKVVHGCEPDPAECIDCGVCGVYMDGDGVHNEDQTFLRADGHSIPVEYSSRPLFDGTRIVGTVVSFSDISERKSAENEIVKLNRDLERRVAQRTAELEAANKEMEAFAYSVSHDLRSPLRSIGGFSNILFEDHAQALDEDGKTLLLRIQTNVDAMNRLINDLLRLSRSTRGEIVKVFVDMSAIGRKAVSDLMANSPDPDRSADFNIAGGLSCAGDPRYLQVVLENLLDNAWKYTRARRPARIEFGTKQVNGEQAFFVRDNGVGFDMQYVDKLFQPFQRLHHADEFEGNGIGLATVKRIVERHGGQIWAESTLGEGATFYFTLASKA